MAAGRDRRQEMVVRVIVEGGILPPKTDVYDPSAVLTIDNTEKLREELSRLFTKAIGRDDISVIAVPSAGYKNAAKKFMAETDSLLYVDLDDVPENKKNWFDKIQNEHIPISANRRTDVFFWIPEMEAWFLKHPDAIERWAENEGYALTAHIATDKLIEGKDIEHLRQKPSAEMKVILARCLKSKLTGKEGKPRKIVYGKLRHAPAIIAFLDANELIRNDSEFHRFVVTQQNI